MVVGKVVSYSRELCAGLLSFAFAVLATPKLNKRQ